MRILQIALTAILGLTISRVCADESASPNTFQYDGRDLVASKARAQAGDPALAAHVKSLCKDADRALKLENFSVVNKPATPPSGDKHDYMSLSPYWWPDPAKPDGKPYIRKDGQVNPERNKFDQPVIDAMSETVETLALAYYFSGDEKYAEKSAQMIRAWFFDEATKMNPNCMYAQIRLGHPLDEASSGVLETNRVRKVIDADALLSGSKNWSADDHTRLQAWCRQFLDYLLTSKQGKAERKQPNNHGSWFALQAGTYALYLGDEKAAKDLLGESIQKRIASQIEPDGKQPFELVRTKAYDYSRYNLEALTQIAFLAKRIGIDHWNFKSDDGRSLRVALEWLAPYASGEKPWDGQQITEPKMAETMRVYRVAAKAYRDEKFEKVVQAAKQRGKIDDDGRLNLVTPFK